MKVQREEDRKFNERETTHDNIFEHVPLSCVFALLSMASLELSRGLGRLKNAGGKEEIYDHDMQ